MTSSLTTSVRSFDFDNDPAPSRKVTPAQVDAQLDLLHTNVNRVKSILDGLLRSDDTLQDSYVRLRMLALEVSTIVASQGWQPKQACALATTGNITLSGEQMIDGVMTSASRVLVKDQTLSQNNGVYVSGGGAWSRATDCDTAAEMGYAAVMVLGGLVNANDSFVVTAAGSTITLGTTAIVWAQFGNSAAGSGGGGSSSTSSGGIGYNVKDTEFAALGDGSSHALSSIEAAAFNTAFAIYGFQGANVVVAGDQRDWAAIQAALYKAANTGEMVYIPPGTYRINRPLSLQWTATPITGQPVSPLICKLYGAGKSSVLMGYGIVAGRAVVEFLGESNGNAANIEISDLQEEQVAGCHKYSFCLRLGDGYVGISLHRVICKGAQALSLKVASSVTYAQLCFVAYQCQFWSNWANRWGSDTGLDVYSVVPESLGSYWDSALFEACFFWGQVDCRAFSLKFHLCLFVTPPYRALPYGATVYLGTAVFDACYFEDHLIGVATLSNSAPITTISIRDCHFSSNNNLTPPAVSQSSIQCSRGTYEHGPVTIEACRFGGTASFSDIDLYGPITVSILRCCHPFGTITLPPTVTPHGLVRMVKWNSNTESGNDVYEFSSVNVKCPILVGPVQIVEANAVGAENVDENSTAGAGSYAARVVKCGTSSLRLLAFSSAHAALANQAWVINATANPLVLGVGGIESVRIGSDNIFRQRNLTWIGGPLFSQTASITVGNTVTEFGIIGSGVGGLTVPANELIAGRTVRYKARGYLSSSGGPTLRMRCKLGGVTIADTGAVAQTGTPTNAAWELDVELVVRTTGAGGTAFAQGRFTYNGVTVPISSTATVAVNTTIANSIDITAQWGTAAAGNTITETQCTPEVV